MEPGITQPAVAVVFFCHDGKGRFVMDLRGKNARDEQGRWEIGSGRLRFEERVEDAIRREVQEEYGTEVLEMEYLGFRENFRNIKGNMQHWVTLDFKVLVKPDLVKNGEPQKLDAVQWFTLDTLPEPLHSQFGVFIEKYNHKL